VAQKKSHEIDGWLARPDPRTTVVLIYGPDRGLVSERASVFVKNSGLAADDPFAVVRLGAEDVDRDPGRLVDEMRTIPMFSDRRLVWLRTGTPSKGAVDAINLLVNEPPPGAILLIEAGDLKKGAPLRATVEAAPAGMALPCYVDEARALDALIDQALAGASLTMTLDARMALKRGLGGDRLASRGEIEKLTLYAQGDRQITIDHIDALSGDASAASTDAVVDAVLLGRIDEFDQAFAKVVATNQLTPLLLAMLRQFQALEAMRDQVDTGGKSASAAVAAARPPVFFGRRETVEKAVARWPRAAIERALDRIQTAILQGRERASLASALTRQALLGLAVESARRR